MSGTEGLSDGDDPGDRCEECALTAEPGTLAYAEMVAKRYGDLDDAAIEDGMGS